MKNQKKALIPIAATLGATGLVILIYMRNILVPRGLHADATGTGGYTTNSELALLILGLLLVAVSATMLIVNQIRKSR